MREQRGNGCGGLQSMAKADAEPSKVLQSAVLVNPTLPAITATANGILQLTEVDKFISIGAADANIRALYQPSQRWGMMMHVDYSSVSYMLSASHIGLRVGPRMSLRENGLSDWYLSTTLIGGISTVSASNYLLAHWGVLGCSSELGRTWVLKQLIVEVGVGLYSTINVGYHAPAQAFKIAQHQLHCCPSRRPIILGLAMLFRNSFWLFLLAGCEQRSPTTLVN